MSEMAYVEIEREFPAPPAEVLAAWSEANRFSQWYGPKGFTIPSCEIDFRVGGRRRITMRTPDGNEMQFGGVLKEIEEGARFVSSEFMAGPDGNPMDPAAMGMGDWPAELDLEVKVEASAGGTLLKLRFGPAPASPMLDHARGGWEQALDKLAEHLAG